jgi:hypothetical protein
MLTQHGEISTREAADRLSIRELFDAYAHCADTRDVDGQKALFTDDTHFVVFMNGEGTEPTEDLHGREALTPVFEQLKTYDATMHFNGQSTVVINGDQASADSYTIAHHLYTEGGTQKLMIAYLRYLDTFVKQSNRWLFAERSLIVKWIEVRTMDGPIGG